ncbi:hypothetical protein OG705_29245 [Streptomyces sp. NBC_00838]|uniref:hypothetical protein n=1 Tax=Streptomyces sp. NBC_00838 TaxID=2903680 RepID=UPI00386DD32F|nr:hypothetical protein OG705_29245 [Streptomyces sp. NBC_00838]
MPTPVSEPVLVPCAEPPFDTPAPASVAAIPAPVGRAAILRERADFLEDVLRNTADPNSDPRYWAAIHHVVRGLRQVADEAAAGVQQPATVPDTERRERYAKAFFALTELPERRTWESLSPLLRKVHYERADAALAVADGEQRNLRDRLRVAEEVVTLFRTELLDLRAELEQARAEGPGDRADTEAPPRRGDAFEQWLKAQRDEYEQTTGREWRALDEVLDTYRLHADTGAPLGQHVCEGRAVRDCECLEPPAATAAPEGPTP